MSTTSPNKKRKQEGENADEVLIAAKNAKLEESISNEGGESDGSDSESDSSDGSENESLSTAPSSSLKTGSLSFAALINPSALTLNGGAPAHLPSANQQPNLPQAGIPPEQVPWIVDLQRSVFSNLLSTFCLDRIPDKITYKGSGYDLHRAYKKFWSKLDSFKDYLKGKRHEKIPNDELGECKLLAIARILRRGWEDEHYFPSQIHEKLLETCIFNRKDLESTTGLSVGSETVNIWTKELEGLLEFEEFKFLMMRRKVKDDIEYSRIERDAAPHQRWGTFLYGWSQNKIEYYFRMLENDVLYSECPLCKDENFNAQHFLGKCEASLQTMKTERHDSVLEKIHEELESAIEREVPYFSEGNDWKIIVMYENRPYEWPKELEMLIGSGRYPHLIAYTMSPKKRALIIEISVAWEVYQEDRKQYKFEDYSCIKNRLEKHGFEVQFEAIILGNRGASTEDLYILFDEVFAMKHPEISRAMEEISKIVVSVPYKDYKSLMENVVC